MRCVSLVHGCGGRGEGGVGDHRGSPLNLHGLRRSDLRCASRPWQQLWRRVACGRARGRGFSQQARRGKRASGRHRALQVAEEKEDKVSEPRRAGTHASRPDQTTSGDDGDGVRPSSYALPRDFVASDAGRPSGRSRGGAPNIAV
jgi:hypothetical protein